MSKKSKKPEYAGIIFDSDEELEMYWWCEEALSYGLIAGFEYQKPTWVLSDNVTEDLPVFGKGGRVLKPKTRVVLRAATYTCDLHIIGAIPLLGVPEFIDVKPKFTRDDARQRLFAIVQKWLYQRHSVLVRPVCPIDLFAETFVPTKATVTRVKQQVRKGYCDLPTIAQYIKRLTEGMDDGLRTETE